MRLRTKVYRSMNSCVTFVHLGLYMLVCAIFESHHKFVLVVVIREFFRCLVDASYGDGMSLSQVILSSK
jgi:hypothetical protein